MPSGGARKGAGRPIGSKKEPTEIFYRRVTAEEKKKLEQFLKQLRAN